MFPPPPNRVSLRLALIAPGSPEPPSLFVLSYVGEIPQKQVLASALISASTVSDPLITDTSSTILVALD